MLFPVVSELGALFTAAGAELALVGGSVRDAFLERTTTPGGGTTDLDFATSARPERVLEIVSGWADASWDTGIAYGTVGLRKGDIVLEVTTYRAEVYDAGSRKPAVRYGESLEDDLARRDFTVNAMAVTLSQGSTAAGGPDFRFVDPYGGLADLAGRRLRTPGRPADSFSDDPLRMMRAARLAAQLGFTVAPETKAAILGMAGRIAIVSAERVREELAKTLLSDRPRTGLTLLVDTGLADHVLPELPKLRLEIDEHHRHKDVYEHSLTVLEQAIDLERADPDGPQPDLVLRLAALLHDVGKPKTRRFEPAGGVSFHHHEVVGAHLTRARMQALRFPKDDIAAVTKLVELHLRFHGYADGEWTDSAVRRYVRDAGELLPRLHKLTRADCTTRNRRKAERLRQAYDALERRIVELREREELDAVRPDLDGNGIMALLGVPPGPVVGRAYRHLLELRLERGPLPPAEAEAALREWWAGQQRDEAGGR